MLRRNISIYQNKGHHAELPGDGATLEAGDRLMDISAQGQDIFTDFDVLNEAGELGTHASAT